MKTERGPLTPRRREIYDFMLAFQRSNGFPPTGDEIALHFGVSKVTIFEALQRLVAHGWCRAIGGPKAARRIEAVPVEATFTYTQVVSAVIEEMQSQGQSNEAAAETASRIIARCTLQQLKEEGVEAA